MAGPAEDFHGPMLIGTVFNLLLFGVMIAQVYFYFTSYARDRLFLKFFVLALFVVDAVNSAFNVAFIYVCLVLHFGDADYLKETNWQFATGPTLTAVIALMVQLFFTWRVYVLTRNWLLVVIVGLLALASAVCGCLTTWEVIAIPQFARFQNFRGIVIVWLAAAAVADIMITIILVWHLNIRRVSGGQTWLSIALFAIETCLVTVQTGLATSVVATVDLTLYLASTSGIHLLFNFALCKLYSNSLMSSLNSRNRWRRNSPASEIIFTEGPRQPDNIDNPMNGS